MHRADSLEAQASGFDLARVTDAGRFDPMIIDAEMEPFRKPAEERVELTALEHDHCTA
jgi:hypothetical protein